MVAGDRRRPATSNAAETVMGSPPNRTADRARGSTSAGARRSSLVGDCASRFAQAMRKPAACRPDARPSSLAGVSTDVDADDGAALDAVATRGTLVVRLALFR